MAVSRSLKNATVTLTDTDGANSLALTLETGDFTCNVPNPVQHVMDRGGPGVAIDGLHEDVTFSMTAQVQSMTADPSIFTIVDGSASGWDFSKVTTGSGAYSGLASGLQDAASTINFVQIEIAIADPAGGSTEYLRLFNCIIPLSISEGMPDTVSLSGTCMGYSGANFLANINTTT